ncbi:fetuin-B [Pelobates cultripes]|uniref:Fetuin-B n=1 Tax=Pelobates cultripes TaxID=61616 RepID=A0AAD1VSP9_PELCU|nr:fetuin-B [Pelobates cultripes]
MSSKKGIDGYNRTISFIFHTLLLRRMKLTILLLVCIQVLGSRAAKKQTHVSKFTALPCNDPGAEAAADLSLSQLNANRRQGAVFGLKRIVNVQEQYEEETGFVYYLTVEVLETECHVLSRKDWKDCAPKARNQSAFGQCKIIFHLNKPQRIAQLYNYDCTLTPVARGSGGCPGCPAPIALNDSRFQDIANKAIEKFNTKSNYNKYFAIGNITKATAQVIAGIAYHVEFTIQETSCNKSVSTENLALCSPLDCEFAHTGYCKGRALEHWSRPNDPYLSVTCKVFEPEDAIVEEQHHQDGHTDPKPEKNAGKRQPGKKEEKQGKKPGKSDHDHDENDGHEHDHQHLHPHEHHHPQVGKRRPSKSEKPEGTITYVGTEEEPKDKKDKKNPGKSKPEKEKGPKGDKTPPPGPAKASKSFIHPFPEQASPSAQCPGEVKTYVPPVAPVDSTALPF